MNVLNSTKTGPIPGSPYMTIKEDTGGTGLRTCVLGKGPEISPVRREPGTDHY